ncbi:MAG: hypothetical protein KAW88_03330 [Candidatus Cloacimonetes bacterium]|nr:hypothetical protein [Candidatus Cloacimonadota bacterium]
MKIILSRKGFDSENGGYPSPILPDGRLISLPIPTFGNQSQITYSKLHLEGFDSYFHLMSSLKPRIYINGKNHPFTQKTFSHFDPELTPHTLKRNSEWRGLFGQVGIAQKHLENRNIKKGDIFLFFGWFKATNNQNGKIIFDKKSPDLHIIFGYLEIDNIYQKKNVDELPTWMKPHPHTHTYYNSTNNTIYEASDNLSLASNLKGSGIFKCDERLVLTKKGCSRSKWKLPKFFKNVSISYHSKSNWKKDYFQSAFRGQEFVVTSNKDVTNWVYDLIRNHSKSK